MKTPVLLLAASLALAALISQSQSAPPTGAAEPGDIYDPSNLLAWCVVPFDAKKRGPEDRADMLQRLGFKRFAYDWRDKDIPTFDAEVEAITKRGIEFTAWWFPTDPNDPTARKILEVNRRHGIHPQLWVMGSGSPTRTPEEQEQRIEQEAERIRKIVEMATPYGCPVELYNHNGWFGNADNEVAVIERLKTKGVTGVGMVYNFSHAHHEIADFPAIWKRIKPHVVTVNVTGMVMGGGETLMPPSQGDRELAMMRIIQESGWRGPVGLIAEQGGDAEVTLGNGLRGLEWLRKELAQPGSGGPAPFPPKVGAILDDGRFGKALDARADGVVHPGPPGARSRPLTIDCWTRLENAAGFNILVASDPKSSAAHWELYSFVGTGQFHVYLPGRGGDYGSGVAICDDRWHHVAAVLEESRLRLYVDGALARDAPLPAQQGRSEAGGVAIGRLVEGGIGCRGWVDEVRLRKAARPPEGLPTAAPTADDETLACWSFENPEDAGPPKFRPPKPPLDLDSRPLFAHPINRDRIYDFYAKQLVQAAAQSPRPGLLAPFPGLDGGSFGHWGNQTEESWNDSRWNGMEVGSVQAAVFRGWNLTVPRGVCVRLGDHGEIAACFDPDSRRWVAAWRGGFVKFGTGRHGFLDGCRPDGERIDVPIEPDDAARRWVYRGYFRNGPRVIFRYTGEDGEWLESAGCVGGRFVRVRERAGGSQLTPLTRGGPAQWPDVFVTHGTLGSGSPYAVDTVPTPARTPWRSLFHFGDHDFFPNGDAALCTMEGEVWRVSGLHGPLTDVRWKRIAAGLHQPLGLKIVEGMICVRGRDQITRLHDLNGDEEADYYECFSNAAETSAGGHDYTTGLQGDAEGRFYFASSHQGVCRTSADGQSNEVLATGFRNPNGLGLGPRGEIVVAVQEGDWTPASMLADVIAGGHYGHGGPRPGPLGHVPPLVYLPRGIDHSCGGQVFVEGGKWGVPAGTLVHLSFGVGAAFLVVRDTAFPDQGLVVPMPGDFASGAHRGRFHPQDGQLWVTGMTGWITYGPEDGCFQRLRHTGESVRLPLSFEARDNGVLLSFAEPIPAATQGDETWLAQSWNYRYGAGYGSEEFSSRRPGQAGHDRLDVTGVHRLDDGRRMFLEIPQLQPAHTLHLHAMARWPLSPDLYLTLHRLGPAFTAFPGYQAIAKVAVPAGEDDASALQPQPIEWERGAPGRKVRLGATAGLQFDQRQLLATAGERLSLTFDNPDVIPHNWVLGTPGSVGRLFDLSNQFVADPRAFAMHYVPPTPDVLVHTRLVEPAGSTTIHFNAPAQPGDYPYVCTFPGHGAIMRGSLRVQ